MLFDTTAIRNFSYVINRRKELVKRIKEEHKDAKKGIVIFFANFEDEQRIFRQESFFYYYTGIEDPGVAFSIELDGTTTLWVPGCSVSRADWYLCDIDFLTKNSKQAGIDHVKTLGTPVKKFTIHPFSPLDRYKEIISYTNAIVNDGGMLFSLDPDNADQYVEQRSLLNRFLAPNASHALASRPVDISHIAANMRRKKDAHEIELLYKAIDITCMGHEAAAGSMAAGNIEAEVKARIEYIFTASDAYTAFPSIVGAGKNSTVLHYQQSDGELHDGDLVVVDIGARDNYYCGDLTRTYPVSGSFTERQKEIYNLVLETQEYIAALAKPGYWLCNADESDKSLHHLAKKYLDERGYGKYFIHGLGHYLGIDTHDVGSYKKPLEAGNVFTIEPGIYIPDEKLGVRIEDNYWMTKKGLVCLSEQLPKKLEDIEQMMQQSFEDDQTEEANA